MKRLEDVLEEIKQYGSYAVSLMFGEDVGCDDSSEKMLNREVKIWWCPVGVVGEARIMLRGKLKDILSNDIGDMDLKKVTNPPKNDEVDKDGLYIWGCSEIMVEIPDNQLKLRNWQKHRQALLDEWEKKQKEKKKKK